MKKLFKTCPDGVEIMIDTDEIESAEPYEQKCPKDKKGLKVIKGSRVVMKSGREYNVLASVKSFVPAKTKKD